MVDEFTEVTHQGWLSRIGSSIKGVLFGLLFFIVAFPLLWWNEGRAVTTAKSLKEGAAAVVSVSAEQALNANDGKLVHLTGSATTGESLRDAQFGVSANAIKLKRTVEMYQWEEESRTEEKRKTGGGVDKVTTYSYEKVWAEGVIDSSSFKKPEGHANPASMPYSSSQQTASQVTVGGFVLSDGLVGQINAWQALPVSELPAEAPANMKVNNDRFYVGENPASPVIGDLRISFEIVPETTVSVVARQQSGALVAYQTKAGRQLEMLELGMHAADAMFQAAMSRNTMLTWIVRAGGFLLMFIGLAAIFKPFAVVADVVPIVGTILRTGIGFFAFIVALPLTLITIAAAWLVYRPLLGGGLLILAIGLLVVGRMVGGKKEPKLPPIPTQG
jgi:hypothetical protein